jgi:hypothetical protein
LEALSRNVLAQDSILYIYADGAKADADKETISKIKETREIIKQKEWCGEVHIIEAGKNKGLAASIIEGVTTIVDKYGKVVVLEDDIVTSPGFLKYMNDGLNLYQNEEKVMHVSGYIPNTTGEEKLPETFFLRFMSCWGWATWKRAWDKIILDTGYLYKTISGLPDYKAFNLEGAKDIFSQIEDNLDGRLNTWAVKWYATIFLEKGLCLYPRFSLVNNIGFDGSGQHCGTVSDSLYETCQADFVDVKPIKIVENKHAKTYLKRFYIFGRDSSIRCRMIAKIKKSIFYKIYSVRWSSK